MSKSKKILKKRVDFPIFDVLEEFGKEPRSDKICTSENRGVKKGPGPQGTRNGELLVPTLEWNGNSMTSLQTP